MASHGEALHQRLGELGAQVVAHLGQGWESQGRKISLNLVPVGFLPSSGEEEMAQTWLPCCSSMPLMDPERSLSYCWNIARHLCMKSHSAEKPNRSIRPVRVLSNMSDRKSKSADNALGSALRNEAQMSSASFFFCFPNRVHHSSPRILFYLNAEPTSHTIRIMVMGCISHCLADAAGMWMPA